MPGRTRRGVSASAGWSGKSTGNRLDVSANAVKIDSKVSRMSTFDGRCSVASANSPGRRPKRSQARAARARSRFAKSVSIITLPTSTIRSASIPARVRLSTPDGSEDEEPVGERVGDDAVQLLGHRAVEAPQARFDMRQRANGVSTAASAAATVDVTSPTTTTQSGRISRNSGLQSPHDLGRLRDARCRSRLPGWRPATGFPARGKTPRSSARRSAAPCARWPARRRAAAKARATAPPS